MTRGNAPRFTNGGGKKVRLGGGAPEVHKGQTGRSMVTLTVGKA
jgi:hypothetical protein